MRVPLPQSARRHLTVPSEMPARRVWAAAVVALLCAAVVLLAPVKGVRVVFAVPFCLFLPGYTLTAALFAKRHLEYQQRLMLVFALSLVTLVLGALALDLTPIGLRAGSWTVLLLVVILGASVTATRRAPSTQRTPRRRRRSRVARLDAVLLLVAAVAAGSALALSRVPLAAPNAVGYSDLWMLPAGSASAPSLDIGVISDEQHPTTYRLLLRLGRRAETIDSSLVLSPGGQRKFVVSLPRSTLHSSGVATAMLYKTGTPGVYRQATALLPLAPPTLR